MIVKVQVALFPPGAPALIYDERRSIVRQVPEANVAARMHGRAKAYFNARVAGGAVELIDEAPEQPW